MKEKEMIDIYDRERHRTGRVVSRSTHLQDGEYRLVVHVCVFDKRGRLLLQQRAKKKRSYTGRWDVSAGGHSIAGETSAQAVERELYEELGLHYDFSHTDPFMTANFEHGFDDYYMIDMDITELDLTLQGTEVSDARFVTYREVCEMLARGQMLPFHRSFFTLLFDIHRHELNFFIE